MLDLDFSRCFSADKRAEGSKIEKRVFNRLPEVPELSTEQPSLTLRETRIRGREVLEENRGPKCGRCRLAGEGITGIWGWSADRDPGHI